VCITVGSAETRRYRKYRLGGGHSPQPRTFEFVFAGVRVNCICAGIIDTPLVARRSAPPEIREAMHHAHPLGRMSKPIEIARCVLFLASDDASFVTGHPSWSMAASPPAAAPPRYWTLI
jgi:hypothetical protein